MHLTQRSVYFLFSLLVFGFCNINNASAQFKFLSEEIRYSVHAKTSILFSTVTGDYNKREQTPSYKMGPSFGCFLSVALNDQWAVEPGAFLSMKGSKFKIDYTTKISNDAINIFTTERGHQDRSLYYFDIPVMLYYRMESKIAVGAGFSGSLLLKSSLEEEIFMTQVVDNVVTTETITNKGSRDSGFKKFDSGFLFSIGYMLKDGLELTASTYTGLLDVMNPDRKFKNAGFGISLSYRFKQLQ